MRRLVLQMQMSVDGYVVDRSGHLESWVLWDWGDKWTWDTELKGEFNAIFRSIGCILLSYPMAKGYIRHWTEAARRFPKDPQYAFAKKIVDTKKIVFSRKTRESQWDNTVVMRGTLADAVNELKTQAGGDIIAFGGVRFASALIDDDLVDEFQFFINPAALGGGSSVGKKLMKLKLVQSNFYGCGIVVNRYLRRSKLRPHAGHRHLPSRRRQLPARASFVSKP